MSYTPTEWATGDVVTADKLNKIEEGIAGAVGVLVATCDPTTDTLDKTWSDINASPLTVVKINEGANNLTMPVMATTNSSENSFNVFCFYLEAESFTMSFEATSADGYPVLQQVS